MLVPNPFPGMDPYLETDLWSSVHGNFAEEIARRLMSVVPAQYVVRTVRRVVLAMPEMPEGDESKYPDVAVAKLSDDGISAAAGLAVLDAPVILKVTTPIPTPMTSIEIRDPHGLRIVTAIEVLSPANKRGSRKEYAQKRRRTLRSSTHLLEIDLLRAGRRFFDVGHLKDNTYFVALLRSQFRDRLEVWPIPLSKPLPTVQVPLANGDADVALDLQAAFQAVYALYRYDREVNYQTPPPGPLSESDRVWLDARLREAGRRGNVATNGAAVV